MNSLEKQNKKILIVDDIAEMRSTIAFEVENLGYEAIEAENGEQAMAILLSQDVDLTISDIRMPNWDGKKLLEELRKVAKQIPPLIFMTGYSELTAKFAYDKGADALISKPFDPEKLVEMIRWFLMSPKDRWSKVSFVNSSGLQIVQTFQNLDDAAEAHKFAMGRAGFSIANDFFSKKIKLEEVVGFDIQFVSGPIPILKGIGRVKWISEACNDCRESSGIEFLNLTGECIDSIVEFVKSQQMSNYIPNLCYCESGTVS